MAVAMAGCSSSRVQPRAISDNECMGMADALQTLKVGDSLPRVAEVLGPPSRTYRTLTTFGTRFDALEYDTGTTPCAQYLLNAPRTLVVLFDPNGQLIGYGKKRLLQPLQSATSVKLNEGLMGRP